nr:Arc family DNA-binding protein [Pseudomonas arcuscaelestis]
MPPSYNAYNSRTADKFVVRLPAGMRERIGEVAKNHHRSMNSEIISRLEDSLSLEEGEGSMLIHSDSLSASEQQMLKAFRKLANMQQKALVDLISVKPTLKDRGQLAEAKVA